MSQTEVQLIKADAVQTADIANSAVTDAKISALTSSKLTGALPAVSAANLTSIPAANLTGTLPAISAANLTSIPAANLTGALPAISGAALTGISAGIEQADVWRMTANLQGSSSTAVITTNLSRSANNTYIGSGMSESSGEFTFPVTGKWLIYVQITAYGQYAYGRATIGTQYSGASGYDTVAHAYANVSQNGGNGGGSSMAIVDISNVGTRKVRFWQSTSSTSGRFIQGSAASNQTAFTFIRLGDA